MSLKIVAAVGAGGAVGAMARYGVGTGASALARGTRFEAFPAGTLAVNVVGCALMGVVLGVADRQMVFSPAMRALLMTGLLGGFTTFSAFAADTHSLLKVSLPMAAVNIALQLVVTLAALRGGVFLASRVM
jgi:CrcB protein